MSPITMLATASPRAMCAAPLAVTHGLRRSRGRRARDRRRARARCPERTARAVGAFVAHHADPSIALRPGWMTTQGSAHRVEFRPRTLAESIRYGCLDRRRRRQPGDHQHAADYTDAFPRVGEFARSSLRARAPRGRSTHP